MHYRSHQHRIVLSFCFLYFLLLCSAVTRASPVDFFNFNTSTPAQSSSLPSSPSPLPNKTLNLIQSSSQHNRTNTTISSVQALRQEFKVEGGLIEILEWLFVAILVAPGTFPLLACMFLSCSTAVQRLSAYLLDIEMLRVFH